MNHKYNPLSNSEFAKHLPTNEESELCKKCLEEYNSNLYWTGMKKAHWYDFNRGWEFGFGMALKLFEEEDDE